MNTLEIVSQSIAAELSSDERRERIISLSASAREGAEIAKRHQKHSVEDAIECGQLLLIEKNFNASKGKWSEYFRVNYGEYLPERTARLWMALARKYAENPSLPEANIMRNGILALDLMPDKVHPKPANQIKVVAHNNHMSPVMRVEAWIREFDALPDSVKTLAYLCQLSEDFSRITAFTGRLNAEVIRRSNG